ncbi:MAG TPA: lysophospholipid acyltransferase family protein [Verrucomicrobiae bacterium]
MINYVLTLLARFITGAGSAHWLGCAPEPKQRIYFANHTSNLDALILWAGLPSIVRNVTRPVAAHDYWTGDPLRRYLASNVFKAILIERKKVTVSTNPIPQVLNAMGSDSSIIIFPEGKRNMGPEIGEFKSGLYHLATSRPDVELVPVYLQNLNRILPKGEFLPVPVFASIYFGAPIKVEEGERKLDFLQRAKKCVEALRSEY